MKTLQTLRLYSLITCLLALCLPSWAATYTQVVTGAFGTALTGQATNVRLTVYDNAGTAQIAATNTPSGNAITESTDAAAGATTGVYLARFTCDTSWLPVHVKFTIVGQAGVSASTVLGSDRAAGLADGYTATAAARITTALPNASPAAAGGLITIGTGAGQLQPNGTTGNLPAMAGITTATSGTAQAGSTSTTIVLAAGTGTTFGTTDQLKGDYVFMSSGSSVGQARTITGWNFTTNTATLSRAWAVTPVAGDAYYVIGNPHPAIDANLAVTAGSVTDASVTASQGDVTTIKTRLGSPVGATFSADIAGVPSGVWGNGTRTLTAFAFTPSVTLGANEDTALTRLYSFTSGTQFTATALALAPTGGSDPFALVTSTAYAGGTFGALFKTNLDAAISSRSTYAGADTAGTTTLLGRIPGTVQPQTGDAYARIGASGAGLTALGDTRLANLDAAVSSRMATFTLPTNFSSLSVDGSGRLVLTPTEHGLFAGDVFNATAASYNTAGTTGAKINAAGSASDPLANALSGYTIAGTGGYALARLLGMTNSSSQFTAGAFALLPNVTLGGYANGQDPTTLLFATPRWQRLEANEVGNYTRNPSTGVITFTRQDGTTFTATLAVDGQGRITGRTVSP